jgi:hypothetical protein
MASFILYVFIQIIPEYQKDKRTMAFISDDLHEIYLAMSKLLECLKFSVGIEIPNNEITKKDLKTLSKKSFSNDEMLFLYNIYENGSNKYIKSNYCYYNFHEDFSRDVKTLQKRISKISNLLSYLPFDLVLVLTQINNTPLYRCIQFNIELNKSGLSGHDESFVDYFFSYIKLHNELEQFDFPKGVYVLDKMPEDIKREYSDLRASITYPKVSRIKGVLSQIYFTGDRWIRP